MIIYSTNEKIYNKLAPHVKHRKFTEYVEVSYRNFELIEYMERSIFHTIQAIMKQVELISLSIRKGVEVGFMRILMILDKPFPTDLIWRMRQLH